ncbi:helix-turn-helix domain-containing protein [Caballeronia sp. LZ043]|uniref:helix-turn-helix domain-containing protein n=1 Tax=Caballeronia sp. LZ043 TaxID=3038569 RepID=UPI002856F297|nr:helix-turn-helix domain-containing protein [Caballeronia sp. LZ043]MDR5826066.1 hypothetical protein [Caballeronia sp. LZ043]
MRRDWFELFDELKAVHGFRSDAQVAESLGVTRSQISAWRNGKSELGTVTKLQILHALGRDDLQSALESLLADENRSEREARHPDEISIARHVSERNAKRN